MNWKFYLQLLSGLGLSLIVLCAISGCTNNAPAASTSVPTPAAQSAAATMPASQQAYLEHMRATQGGAQGKPTQ